MEKTLNPTKIVSFNRENEIFPKIADNEPSDFFGHGIKVNLLNDLFQYLSPQDQNAITDYFTNKNRQQNQVIKFSINHPQNFIEDFLMIPFEFHGKTEKILFVKIGENQRQNHNNLELNEKLLDVLEETGIKLSKLLDFHLVLEQVLVEVKKVIPFDSANIMILENENLVIKHKQGYEKYNNHPLNQKNGDWKLNIHNTKNLDTIVKNQQPLLISDTYAEEGWLLIEGTEEIKSWIGVPIISQEKLIGIISIDKTDSGFFTPQHKDILMRFAGQASLAMQNAIHFQELNQILNREQKLNQLIHLISKTLDIEIITKSVCDIVAEIFECSATSVLLRNGENEFIGYRSFYDENGKILNTQIAKVINLGIAKNILDSNQPLYLEDYSQSQLAKTFWIDGGYKTFSGVPISIGNSVIGAIGLFHKTKGKKYLKNDIQLLESIAHQTFIAVQNAKLYEAEKTSRKNADTLREAASAITSALNLDQVLERVLVFLEHVVPYDSATIFLIEKDVIKAVAGRGLPNPELVLNKNFPLNNALFDEAQKLKKPVILANAQLDSRFQQWGAALYIAGWMGIPIIWHEQVIGMLTIDSITPNAYQVQHASIAQAYADQAAIAIQNSKLFEKTKTMSITDPLTNLYNRRYFFEIAQAEFEKSKNTQLPFSIILVDMDNFKTINDTCGHLTGDQILIAVANTIRETLREDDLISRFGGDEFIALIRFLDEESTRKIVERLENNIKKIAVPNSTLNVAASIGFSSFRENTKSLDEIINIADKMLYKKKEQSKKIT